MLRKKGKLPGEKISIKYTTEYSEDILEVLKECIEPHDKFLLVDDLVATGGTLNAGVRALAETNEIVGALCVLQVDVLYRQACDLLSPYEIVTLI
jgi:adenine phosphoribosyltransferase